MNRYWLPIITAARADYGLFPPKDVNSRVSCFYLEMERKVWHLQNMNLGSISHWEAQEVVNASNVIFQT